MNRHLDTTRSSLRLALALTLGIATATLTGAEPARADEASSAPPPAIKTMLARMQGTWTAKDVAVTVAGRPMKAQGRVTCAKAAGGGLQCHVQATMPGGMKQEETNVIGWDPQGGKVHIFAVNPKYTHDHVGTLDGDVLSLSYTGTRDGKPWEEALSFTFKGDKELVWKDTCTSGGQVVFAGEGTYRK
jgi:hypothetical protein